MHGMNDIIWLTMRRLRLPLIVMILVFFASVLVMIAMPGQDAAGHPTRMNYLDATYFVAIMATTVGFGEVPFPFTDAQRMVVLALILPNVAAWFYAIGAIINLFMEPQFRHVLALNRFGRRVRMMGPHPFYLVCGFGNTGETVVRGLLNRNKQAVAIDCAQEVIDYRGLDADFAYTPMFAGDTTDPKVLEIAGLGNPRCKGVIITTQDDHANLTIAITSKLLYEQLPVYARCETQRISDNMKSFNTDEVINPYEIFADRLHLALTSPVKYMVQDWLITVPDTVLRDELLDPPRGRWIICGAGRFGEQVIRRMARDGIDYTVVDVHPERVEKHPGAIEGRGTEAETLERAGIHDAVGVIACTSDDVDNLSIIMTARNLKDDLFLVIRQEDKRNDRLFTQLGADLVANRNLIVARRILAYATNPMLKPFLEHLERQDDSFAEKVYGRLKSKCKDHTGPIKAPKQWTVTLGSAETPGANELFDQGMELTLSYLLHNTRSDRQERLNCVCLEVESGAKREFLPSEKTPLRPGDRLLFAGWGRARDEMMWSLEDPVLLLNVATPGPAPRTSIGRWLQRRNQADSGLM